MSLRTLRAVGACAVLACCAAAFAASDDDGLARFRATYKELVETNTTLSAGDCTLAAERMAAHLKAAGYPDADLRIFVPEGHPKEGGLIAVLHGADHGVDVDVHLALKEIAADLISDRVGKIGLVGRRDRCRRRLLLGRLGRRGRRGGGGRVLSERDAGCEHRCRK